VEILEFIPRSVQSRTPKFKPLLAIMAVFPINPDPKFALPSLS
jgi:hypothetical protein